MSTATKERPILFSTPMIRAILNGHKTQTRRVVKPQPVEYRPGRCSTPRCVSIPTNELSNYLTGKTNVGPDRDIACPYGDPGDMLYVREQWAVCLSYDSYAPRDLSPHVGTIQYKTGGGKLYDELLDMTCFEIDGELGKWRPSIHMPRWASRITLEVTDVRVERLQDIDPFDCVAEGCDVEVDHAVPAFINLWDSINGKPRADGVDISWAANPWVWVVEFRMVTP